MANNIEELRSILFDTIRQVKGGEIDLDKARHYIDLLIELEGRN